MSPRSPGSTINFSMAPPFFLNGCRKEHPEMIPAALLGSHAWKGTVEIPRRESVPSSTTKRRWGVTF